MNKNQFDETKKSSKVDTATAVKMGCIAFNKDGSPDMRDRLNRRLFGPGTGLKINGEPDMRLKENKLENNKKILSKFNK